MQTSLQQSSALLEPHARSSHLLMDMKALAYKSGRVQSKQICSNICQMVTPLLCILFTLILQRIVGSITTNLVSTFPFPQPLAMPVFKQLAAESLHLDCKELYFYQRNTEDLSDRIMSSQLKQYCASTNRLTPDFTFVDSVNKDAMITIQQADSEQFQRGDDILTEIPDGLLNFHEATGTVLNLTYAINDLRLPEYHRNNGITKVAIRNEKSATIVTYLSVTEGVMQLMERVNRGYLGLLCPGEMIVGSFMFMPFNGQDDVFFNKLTNIAGPSLYPLGLSLLLPIILYQVVSEKEKRLIQIMRINGLNIKHYWLNFFLFNTLIHAFTFALFYFFGTYVVSISFFLSTSLSIFLALFAVWTFAQISLATFAQIFIHSAKAATLVGYMLSIFSTLVGSTISQSVYPVPMEMPLGLLIYPPFSLCRAIYLIGAACSDLNGCYTSLSGASPELQLCLLLLLGWLPIFFLSIYLNQMVQQDYGVADKPWAIQQITTFCSRLFRRNQPVDGDTSHREMKSVESFQGMHQDFIDSSVNIHEKEVEQLPIGSLPLIVRGLSKKYRNSNGNEATALKPVSFSLNHNEIFGLIGPNGAGKTTLISLLTGVFPQTTGEAWIHLQQVGRAGTNKQIGMCPQFNLLWDDLTVEEHLNFYARLKGAALIQVEQVLNDVDLLDERRKASRVLSGGQQRRLSIGIALIGNPKIVFLDEPTSGLDPFHQRQVWDIILKCRARTSILLTTHLMEEVEILCSRVGIIIEGRIRCIGSTQQLKDKFGKGYRLTIRSLDMLKSEQHRQFISELIKKYELQLFNSVGERSVLKVSQKSVFKCVKALNERRDLSWGIAQPTLYDVLVRFLKQ